MRSRPVWTAKAVGILVLLLTTVLLSAQDGASDGQTILLGSAVRRVILEQRFHLSRSMTPRDAQAMFPEAEMDYSGYLSVVLDDESLAPFLTLSILGGNVGIVASFEMTTNLIHPSKLDKTIPQVFEEIKRLVSDVLGEPYSESLEDYKDMWILGSLRGKQTKAIAGWVKGDYMDGLLRYDETGDDSGYFTLWLAVPQ